MLTTSNIFPRLVSASWVRGVGIDSLICKPLASDLYWVLVSETGSTVANIHPASLAREGLSLHQALEHAAANHHSAWNDGRFRVGFSRSPEGLQFGVADGSWMAPPVLLNPRFYELMSQYLRSKELVVVVPNQELLLVIPNRPECSESAPFARLIAEGRQHPQPVSAARLLLSGGFPSEIVAPSGT